MASAPLFMSVNYADYMDGIRTPAKTGVRMPY